MGEGYVNIYVEQSASLYFLFYLSFIGDRCYLSTSFITLKAARLPTPARKRHWTEVRLKIRFNPTKTQSDTISKSADGLEHFTMKKCCYFFGCPVTFGRAVNEAQ